MGRRASVQVGARRGYDFGGSGVALDVEVPLGAPRRQAGGQGVDPTAHGDDRGPGQDAGLGELQFGQVGQAPDGDDGGTGVDGAGRPLRGRAGQGREPAKDSGQ